MTLSNIHEAKTQLSQLINRALAGEEVVIARAGEPLVRLMPVYPDTRPRQGGQLQGRIRMSDDFDVFGEKLEEMLSAGEGA
ncbi:type II toxin-antitoxin system Phd/YefM family antitoxin [Tautonia rosea]|uniref:type II toxin-antitoxin system Phd/YefM family antitoxin n=1 Tax=Tautonia rosea TaxID=2728037 RepID=UPI001474F8C1|nr:type II toxin-antitoxin system prevent-host-death family antitoxin [Tautonia rosea]